MADRVEVSIDIEAPPIRIYELVSDLPRMGEWSPECVKCEWRGGASGAVPGARFKGYNRLGWRRWNTKGTVVAAEPGQELSFDIASVGGLPVARWTYLIEEAGEGRSRVTERWDDKRGGLIKLLGRAATGIAERDEHNANGMRETLARIKEEAEAR
ncbi:MAG TPA: SRPBCC family protein [Acidimicrobiia bacterium]|nr:SRPBCC family protein [Acidimicrobiia bacterium]